MSNVTVYHLPKVVQLVQNSAVSVGTVINRTDFNVHKGVTNEIEFLIKTIDRKPSQLRDRSFVIHIVDPTVEQVVIESSLLHISPERGHCRLVLSAADLAGLNPGFYRYAITETRADSQVMIYTDQNHSIRGFLEVFQGPFPATPPSVEVTSEFITPVMVGNPLRTRYTTFAQQGAAQKGNRAGTHVIAIHSKDFSGSVSIQASLSDESPTDLGDWFDVSTHRITETDTVTGIPFIGNYQWVRVHYTPDPIQDGAISKIVFRS